MSLAEVPDPWAPPSELWTPPDDLVAPAHLWVPESTSSAGLEAIDLAASAGLHLDPEQQLMVLAVLAENGEDWAALEAAIIEARQNGKTVVLEAIVLAALYLFLEPLVIWSAHLFPTTQEAFRDLVALIDGAPHLSREVKNISFANGEEEIELYGDRRVQFKARTRTGGRGLSGRRVILDEAFALIEAMMGSLFPTMTAQPNPQVIYASSAGHVGSGILRRIRDRGRNGGDENLVYVEYCAPEGGCRTPDCDHRVGTTGCAVDDEANLVAANPATRRGRVMISFLRKERVALSVEEYVREVCGWWDEPAEGEDGVPLEKWNACAEPDAALTDPPVLAFDVAPSSSAAAIAACGGAIEIVAEGIGASWVVPRLAELIEAHGVATVGLDPSGPAGALVPELIEAGYQWRSATNPNGVLVAVEGKQFVQACGSFYGSILDETLRHRNEPSLNAAIVGAGRKKAGDAWRWSRLDSATNIAALIAATIGRFLWTTAPAAQEAVVEVT